MVSAINSALSGYAAASQRLNVAAQNIANSDSGNYVPQQVTQSSQPGGGVTTGTRPVNPPSVKAFDQNDVDRGGSGIVDRPNVDQAKQLVDVQLASYNAQGNLAVIKTQDKLLKSVLNIIS